MRVTVCAFLINRLFELSTRGSTPRKLFTPRIAGPSAPVSDRSWTRDAWSCLRPKRDMNINHHQYDKRRESVKLHRHRAVAWLRQTPARARDEAAATDPASSLLDFSFNCWMPFGCQHHGSELQIGGKKRPPAR